MSSENGSMNPDLESALVKTVLNLEEIDKNLYRGTHLWKPRGRTVFGGQVVGQALAAAGRTVPDHVHVHSLHSYFVRGGTGQRPILYHVERTRDGRSFCTRTVVARQDGQVIFTMQVSYHKIEDSPIEYQVSMPVVPLPSNLKTYKEVLQSFLDDDSISSRRRERISQYLAEEVPIEMKPVDELTYTRMKKTEEPKTLLWVRTHGYIGKSDNTLHRCIAAYISDYRLHTTAMTIWPKFRVTFQTSLDHSMWFHAPFRADEWMLYEMESPRNVGGRSLVFGRLWREDGVLAVTVAQESIHRGHFLNKL